MTTQDTVEQTLERLRAKGEPCALVTVVRAIKPTSANAGEKAVVTRDGQIHGWIGGGCAQPAVTRTVAEVLADGEPRLIRVAPPESEEKGAPGVVDFNMGCASRGTLDLFIEPMQTAPVVRVLGAAPTARHLVELAARVGFDVQVAAADTAPDEFPGASRHHPDWAAPGDWPAVRWAVVATQGQGDRKALKAALDSPAEAIAFIASRRKRDRQLEALAESGYGRDRLAAIHAPAGVDVGARTPEEIALTVVTQLIEWRRRGVPRAEAENASADASPEKAGSS